jgi:hypothetical protein
MSQDIILPALGLGPVYDKATIWIPQLLAEASRRGESLIENKNFIDCQLEGPCVIVPVGQCDFSACDFGWSGGDVRNLLLQPMGPNRIIGAIGFKDCTFTRCTFISVGYSGPPEFLDNMTRNVAAARP